MFQELVAYVIWDGEIFFSLYGWAVVLDILTGVACAVRSKSLYSKVGLNGFIRHLIVFILVVLSTTILYSIGYEMVAHAFHIYAFSFYMISVIENMDILGGNFLPDWLEDFFVVLKGTQNNMIKSVFSVNDNEKTKEKTKENIGE